RGRRVLPGLSPPVAAEAAEAVNLAEEEAVHRRSGAPPEIEQQLPGAGEGVLLPPAAQRLEVLLYRGLLHSRERRPSTGQQRVGEGAEYAEQVSLPLLLRALAISGFLRRRGWRQLRQQTLQLHTQSC